LSEPDSLALLLERSGDRLQRAAAQAYEAARAAKANPSGSDLYAPNMAAAIVLGAIAGVVQHAADDLSPKTIASELLKRIAADL
jgi:hypothetical protein